MSKIKNIFFLLLAASFICSVAGCGYSLSEDELLQQLHDLKAEVELLESEVKTKKEGNSKLKERIAELDEKIAKVSKDYEVIQERCP